ncbi:MAG TPA: MCE family protein [Acidimicrobiales bacterium]|nr:MCE family protein [Acidimicrobiales bacterium]
MTELPRSARAVIGAAIVVVLVAVSGLIVKASYGSFSDQYPLQGLFARAGEGLHPSSQVQYRGVTVGEVTAVKLVDRRAEVQMKLDHGFGVPVDAVAAIAPKNVFGEETVNLTFPHGQTGPMLRAGGTITNTTVSDEFTQLLAAADPLLNEVNGQDLATVISQLAIASAGQGPAIRASIEEGTKLADLFDQTLQAQIRALDSFASFSEAIAPVGPSIDSISASNNQWLPTFNAQAAAYDKLLAEFTPVANELAAYLSDYHPDITTMLQDGVNVSRVLIARQSQISDVIHGLYRYLYKFASGAGPELLPDGSKFAYFKTFIMFSDVNSLVCSLIAPPQSGLSSLAPLQQALTGPGSPFNCSAQMAAFNAAQGGAVKTSPLAGARQAAQNLSNAVGAVIGTPQPPRSQGLDSILQNLMGANQ